MNWIKTRSSSPDEAIVQSIVDTYHLRFRHILSNRWMNLDNGHELWMLHDDRDEVRIFRHFPTTHTVIDVTTSIVGGHASRRRAGHPMPYPVSRWEACIDKLLNATRVDDENA